ncbi:MAG: DoxX family protein, partial [Burkholderiales bacterium]
MKIEDVTMQKENTLSERMRPLASVMGVTSDVFYFAKKSAGPVIEFLIRLWLAQIFFVSGVLKAANWDNALYLSANEYPVAWMNPVTAAYIGAAIECLGSVMLAAGLGTRIAAVAMLVLSLVIQFNYLALDVHLFWAALFGWFAVRGAGKFSLDRLLARGGADSALPFAAATLRIFAWITKNIGPFYQLLLRVWVASALFIASAIRVFGADALWEQIPRIGHMLPLRSASDLAGPFALACALLLLVGFATRLAGLSLVVAFFAMAVVNPWHTETGYWIAALALIA